MLTDEQFDELVDKLLREIAPKLGVELKEENKADLSFKDKNGVTYYLDECEALCAITTNTSFFLHVEDGIDGLENYEEYWLSSWGDKFDAAELAYVLRNNSSAEVIQG